MANEISGTIEYINAGSANYAIAASAYGYCTTLADEPAKTVSMTDFILNEGVTVHVKFQYNNTALNPTLNINNTGAKPIVIYGTTKAGTADNTTGWHEGAVISFTYDGSNWVQSTSGINNVWSLINDTYNTLMPTDGATNGWIKIGTSNTSYGLLPSQSGNAGSGHNYLGTNDWYWSAAFIDTVHGNLDGNAATATKLFNTPNNTTTFLRGDNTWSNILAGTLRVVTLETINTTLNGAAIRFLFSDRSNSTYGLMQATRAENKGGQLVFEQYSESSSGTLLSYREQYYLPEPTADLTTNKSYNILTTKDMSFSITGNAATVSRAIFGDANNGEHNANNIISNGLYYYTSNGPSTTTNLFKSTDGAIYCQAYDTSQVAQIAQDYRNGALAVRGKNNGTWQEWLSVPLMKNDTYPSLLSSDGTNTWIKIGTSGSNNGSGFGLLPCQSGNAGNGHNYIGTDSWYWKQAYIDEIMTGNIYSTGMSSCNFGNPTLRHHTNLACYESGSSSIDGTIKIKLPNTTNVMMVLRIIVYDYSTDAGAELLISGCVYSDKWYNYSASVVGSYTKGIRLAYDGTNYCILLGTISTTWDYTKVVLADIYSGYTVQPISGGYDISLITSESGYTVTEAVNTCLQADKIHAAHAYVGNYNNTSYALSTQSFICQSWIRTTGGSGWYNETYEGGWYMTDNKWLRTYNKKPILVDIENDNTYGIGTHGLALGLSGSSYVSLMLKGGNTMYGFAVNQDGNWYFGKRTSQSFESASGDTYIYCGNSAMIRPFSDNSVDLGTSSYRWKECRAVNFYGELIGNAATATKLYSTPNNTTTFLRGDNTWSNTITDVLKITKNGNTVTIGSQNSDFCHIYNSANIPFVFNHSILCVNNGNLGSSSYPFGQIYTAGGTMSGTLAIVNNSQDNATYNSLLYVEHKAQNDWGIFVEKGGNADFGIYVNCASAGSYGIYCVGRITGTTVYGAVWNDYAECRNVTPEITPGHVVYETNSKVMHLTNARLQSGCRVISDTYGMCIGETEEAKTPIAVTGRVLVYPYRSRSEYQLGAAVCSAPNGTVDIMTREEIMTYPERIIGTVSEIPDYEIWHAGERDGAHEIKVNGRIWIYVR